MLPRRVTIVEVGPRDGLQHEPNFIPTAQKVELIRAVVLAGVRVVEVAAFLSPTSVPQLADADAVVTGLGPPGPGFIRAATTFDLDGLERALRSGIEEIRLLVGATEAYNRHMHGEAAAATLARYREVAARVKARQPGPRLTGIVSVAFGCPYTGDVPPALVLDRVRTLLDCGVDGVVLADTAGMADPNQVSRGLALVQERWPDLELTVHLHNTRGMGLANALAALQAGIWRYETAIGGLGSSPFAPRAAGNLSTEDMVHMLHAMGIETGIDLERLLAAVTLAEQIIGRELPGHIGRAGVSSRVGSQPPGH